MTNQLDIALGAKLRLRRKAMGVSQEQLAQKLGISFQQLQKYESGQNRISASRLQQLAELLATPLDFFLPSSNTASGLAERDQDGFDTSLGHDSTPASNLTGQEVQELLTAYSNIKSPAQRRQLLQLMQAMQNKSRAD